MNKKSIYQLLIIVVCIVGLIQNFGCKPRWDQTPKRKPVIYLYPEAETLVEVKVSFKGKLAVTYPEYKDGWSVKAFPDGKLIDTRDNKEYSYLFWEGENNPNPPLESFATGFVVKGEETHLFLQDKLNQLGMLPKEYNEFIVYWYPILKNNKFNFIHFAVGEEYDQISTMEIDPKPQSMLRVFMYYKPLEKSFDIAPQNFTPFQRNGFTVVEWGGGEMGTKRELSSVY